MKLRNKKTGKVIEWFNNTDDIFPNSLAKLNEVWEDYDEPESYWYIAYDGSLRSAASEGDWKWEKQIGNCFETKEEAEKAVEKLRAFKRLKDKGFRFRWIDMQTGQIKYSFFLKDGQKITRKDEDDLLLLFGGEE